MARRAIVAVGTITIGALGATLALPPTPRLVWNASASAPLGLYLVSPAAPLARGDMVVARLPKTHRRFAAVRHYLPENVPLVKRVAAVAGQRVCARNAQIMVDGVAVAIRRGADAHGRPLPWWRGCRRLRAGSVFLLMPRPDSFDGRYVGLTAPGEVLGRARLIFAARPGG